MGELCQDRQGMVDVLDAVIEANKPAIDLFGHGLIVLVVCILVELVGVPEPSGSQRSILRRGHQLRLHDQVHTQCLACMIVIARASQLDAASSNKTPGIPRSLISVAHTIRVNSRGNELWISSAGLGLGRVKALGPELLQRRRLQPTMVCNGKGTLGDTYGNFSSTKLGAQ